MLQGKVAVITGGASGMGQATALRFLEEGAAVVIGDRNAETGAKTLELARERGFEAIRFVQTDVTEESDVERFIRSAVDSFGRLDCVFCNAGAAVCADTLLETSVESFDKTIAINLRGIFLGFKHGGRVLKAQGQGGSMIATSSCSAFVKTGQAIYATAKAGVHRLVTAFVNELGPDSIRVNTIVPGAILTPMYGADHEQLRPSFEAAQLLPRVGEPIDIANAALFLASDQSRFVTGASIVVDGGMLAEGPQRYIKAMQAYRSKKFGRTME